MGIKNTVKIVILLLFWWINASADANCFLSAYFQDLYINGREITFIFKDSGVRYQISIDGEEGRISEYGEKLTIKDNTSIRLVSKGNSLIISSIRKDIIQELTSLDIKNIDLLTDYAFLVKENIDLRPAGKEGKKKTFLIFAIDHLPEPAKEVLSSLKTNGSFTILDGSEKIAAIECGANHHDAFDISIPQNTEKFIKYFGLSFDRESAEPFEITPVQILQNPLFEKFELKGYSCEFLQRDGILSEVFIYKQNEKIAWIKLMTAKTNHASIITLGDWLTCSSMPIDLLLEKFALEKNEIGEICFFDRKFYNKSTKCFSRPHGRFFFIRHGVIVLLTNTTETCPVGELAKAIDDKILEALAECRQESRERTSPAKSR